MRRPLLALVLVAACSADVPPPAPTSLAVPTGAQEATVVRHSDGDTFVLRGIGVGPLPAVPTKVRLLEVDTPEIHPSPVCFGTEAADRTAELIPKGARVRVEADRDLRDRYGRLLLYVWTEDGASLEEVLLREGYARVLYVRPNDRHLTELRQIEARARGAKRGMWGRCRA
ncbi:MAG: thermonuclease family protein [Actinobacteria bacterium]|nr:thermonuclease family protein [Actinomycetota bacterium]MCA1720618.1 thermonuclease family protein [Actinomycetota bacterium]